MFLARCRKLLLRALAEKKAVIWIAIFVALTLLVFLLLCLDSTDHTSSLEEGSQSSQLRVSNPLHRNTCPSYFAWIHEDLAPWNQTGITAEHIQEAKRRGDLRIVIVDGKIYFEQYHECIQTRANITLHGLTILLQKVPPGTIPDMEMVFMCNDFPEILKVEYQEKQPPPMFSYCTTRQGIHFDILFPDWSFWGWPQVRIRPWETESVEIFEGSSIKNWTEREPIAYWKGNIWVSTKVREDLLQCNDTKHNVVVYYLDWGLEAWEGYKTSSLAKQCHTRYKVYVEGRGWSASLKYVMSCGSTMLHIEPDFWEFFARSWTPFVEYFPISRENMCDSIKYAVDWGNSNPKEAAEIGHRGQKFLREHLTMDHVYSYMVHVMQAYAKLQRFTPQVDQNLHAWNDSSDFPPTNATEATPVKLCQMLPRNQELIAKTMASQMDGYKNKPHLSQQQSEQ